MTPACWRLASGITLLHRRWDDGCVVFFAGPGDTQLMSGVGLELLQALARGPLGVDALIDVAIAGDPESDRDSARFMLADLIGQLHKAGLVDPVDE